MACFSRTTVPNVGAVQKQLLVAPSSAVIVLVAFSLEHLESLLLLYHLVHLIHIHGKFILN